MWGGEGERQALLFSSGKPTHDDQSCQVDTSSYEHVTYADMKVSTEAVRLKRLNVAASRQKNGGLLTTHQGLLESLHQEHG